MTSQEIEFFDLASSDGNICWSLNPWKPRLALNYKKLPYKTTFLEYPQLEPTLKALGVPPNKEGMAYTSPTVRFPDGTAVMDSKKIAAELEKRHPTPSLHLDEPVITDLEEKLSAAITAIRGIVFVLMPRKLLNPESKEYFERTRAIRFGKPLAELERETDTEEAWGQATPKFQEMGDLLKKHDGPFFLGDTFGWADIILLGALQWFRRMDEKIFQMVLQIEPTFAKLYDAGKQYLERDSY